MRILTIEDNLELSQHIQQSLSLLGFQVDSCNCGLAGEELAFINPYDAILLDLNLPDKDGLEILSFLRKENIATPIIIITARDEVKQRIVGLNLGADDYVTKPFDLQELAARIYAVIRRFYGRANPDIQIGPLLVSPASRYIAYNRQVVALKAKEFDMLEIMASVYPNVISMEQIALQIYDENAEPSSSVLRVHMSRLKRALREISGQEVIKNIRGKGYQLCISQIQK